jgi:hypothetical protein
VLDIHVLYNPTNPQFMRPHGTQLSGEATLHVCTVVSNPVRYASRYKLFEAFKSQTEGQHVKLWTVEMAYGNRPFVVTEQDNDYHLQLRTPYEIWHKENALNLLMNHICSEYPDAEYFAWVDADITFVRSDWAYETIQVLQHYDFVQMFSHAQDVGPKFEPIGSPHVGFLYAYCNDLPNQAKSTRYVPYGYGADFAHPGYAWAARRSALDKTGGLLDVCILGSADHNMAMGLVDQMERSIDQRLGEPYKEQMRIWGDRCVKHIKRNVGYVPGMIMHHWHGRKADRQYRDRGKILVENNYNPHYDLKRDTQGLYQLTERSTKLRDDIRSYFRARNEDSIDYAESN